MLEKDFYNRVEQPGYLKRMLYGDSVANYTNTIIQKRNSNDVSVVTFDELWDYLIQSNCQIVKQNDKEYIYLTDEFRTISYDSKNDEFLLTIPQYIVRHYIEDELISLQLSGLKSIDVTKNHSMLEYDLKTSKMKAISPLDCRYLPILDNQYCFDFEMKNCEIINIPNKNIRVIHIKDKKNISYKDYVYDLCIPQTQNFVANGILVHNTDSIFYVIPTKDPDKKTPEELWDIAMKTSEAINDLIIDYTKNTLLPRCNIDPDENQTFFKTELLMSALMLLNVKKNYAFKLLVKEGNVLEKPEVSYTGIQVVKSNTAKFTQNLLKEMIEEIVLNEKILNQDKKNHIVNVIDEYHKKIKLLISNFEFEEIGIPGKWSKSKLIINGMKLYNQIMNEEIFTPLSAGKFIYCKFGINFGKDINGICVPYTYDKELLKEKLEANKIIIDENKQWETLLTTTCKRVLDLVKTLKDN